MLFANIRITKGSKNLHGWYIHPIPYEMTIKDFFEKLITRELFPESNIVITNSEIIDRVEISETPTTITTQVSLNCGIMELTTSIGKNIHYQLKTDDVIPNLVPQRNSLMILMQNAC